MNPSLFDRRQIVWGGLAFSLTAIGAQAQGVRDAAAEGFVQAKAQEVVRLLADRRQTPDQKRAAFRRAIDELADVPRITNFVLGKYGRTITAEQRGRFAKAFRAYVETVYHDRLNDYRGERLKVVGSQVRKPGDVVVSTQITGGQLSKPEVVAWRVLASGGNWRVVDVQVQGVWLAVTQQQDFVSTIDNAGGNIDVLIGQLQQAAEGKRSRR